MPTLDFKALNQEKEEFKIVLESKTIILPKVFPADVVLGMEADEIDRLEKGEVEDEEAGRLGFGLIERIFGEEDWKLILREVGIENVPMLIQQVLGYYGMGNKKEKGPKDQDKPDPNRRPEPPWAKAEEEAPTHPEASPSEIASNTGEPLTPISNDTGQSSGESTTPESSTSSISLSGYQHSPQIASS